MWGVTIYICCYQCPCICGEPNLPALVVVVQFKEKRCENCLVKTLTREEDGKKIRVKRYCHKALKAKLVLAENIVISLDMEFIENGREDVEKNDCEINAVKRL